MLKVIAFDVFGTLTDMSAVPRSELRAYGEHISEPYWSPLHLPESWQTLPLWPDVKPGLNKLRKHFQVVTLTNAPLHFQTALWKHHDYQLDAMVPLESRYVYKPNLRAYGVLFELLRVEPKEVMMVTANKRFGDLEASRKLGMHPAFINREDPEDGVPGLRVLANRILDQDPDYWE